MSVKVFIVGRPGCGKSTIATYIKDQAKRRSYSYIFMEDYDILYKMFLDDIAHKQFKPTNYGGFDVLDFGVLDKALMQLEKNVRAMQKPEKAEIIVIEFARNDYRTAFKVFSPDFLRDAYVFFAETELDQCIQRIRLRVTNPPRPGYHFVSEQIMRTYYSEDNWEYVAYQLKKEYSIYKEVVAYHNTGSREELFNKVSDFAEDIFRKEFASTMAIKQESVGNSLATRV